LRRDKQSQSIWHDFNPDRKVAQELSIGLDRQAFRRARAGATFDCDCVKQLDLSGKSLAPKDDCCQEAHVIEPVASLECYQTQRLIAEGGSRRKILQHAAEIPDPDGEKLGYRFDAKLAAGVFDNDRFKCEFSARVRDAI
jgi:hypothetical protein